MYITSRIIKTTGDMPTAIGFVQYVLGVLNDRHGGEFSAGVQIGGDPSVIGIVGRFEDLEAYGSVRASMMADDELAGAIRMAGHLIAEAQDTLWRVHIPAGEPEAYSTVTSVRINLTALTAASTYAAEVAATVSSISGIEVGLSTAVTGDRSRLNWVSFAPDLATIEEVGDKLEASSDYLDLFKQSEGLVVPSSLRATLWQGVAG